MKLVTCTLQNFLGIGSAEISLADKGLVLIQGVNEDDTSQDSNGSGKSSLIDGIFWIGYGETARGEAGDEIVNREAGSECIGTLVLDDNGSIGTITRWRKAKGFHKKAGVKFEVDGVDKTGGTDALTQAEIDSFIGCSKEVFCASIYAGQEAMPDIPKMGDRQLKSLIEEAAGIDMIEAAYDLAKEKRDDAKTRLDKAMTDRKHAEDLRAMRRDAHLEAREAVDLWNLNREERVEAQTLKVKEALAAAKTISDKIKANPLSEFDNKISAVLMMQAETEKLIAGCDKKVAATEAERAKLQGMDDAISDARDMDRRERDQRDSRLDKALTAERNQVAALEPAVNKAATEVRIAEGNFRRLVDEAKRAKHEFDHVNDEVGKPCGECGKTIEAADLAATAATRKEKAQLAANAARKAQDVHLAAIEVHQKAVALRDEAKADTSKSDAIRAEIDAVPPVSEPVAKCILARDTYKATMTDVSGVLADKAKLQATLKVGLEAHRKLTSERGEVEALSTKLEHAKTLARQAGERLKEIQAEQNPHDETVQKRWDEIIETDAVVVAKEAAVEAISAEVQIAGHTVDVFGPKGVRARILDTVTPYLNDRTAHYLGTLSDGNLAAVWTTLTANKTGDLKEKFSIEVTKYGAGNFKLLSGGEKRKVRLACMLALQDLVASRASKPIEIWIGDEIDTAMDPAGLERLMGLLEAKAREKGTVLVVSHLDMGDWIRDVATVRMKDKQATVEGVLCL